MATSSDVAAATLPLTPTSIVIPESTTVDEGKEELQQSSVSSSVVVDLSRGMVKLPMDLVKVFDVVKTWPKDSGMAMLIKNTNGSADSEPQFVLAMELSMLGVIHGSVDSATSDSTDSSNLSVSSPWAAVYPSSTKRSLLIERRREKKPSLYQSDEVAMVGNYNRVYHSRLVTMLAQRKIMGKEALPKVTIVDDSDESCGYVPQLRSNMFVIVPVKNWTQVEVAVQRGKATLVALNRQDMDEWMRTNVVGVDVHCLKHYLGTLSLKYRELSTDSPQEFATWLDQAAVKVQMFKSKEQMTNKMAKSSAISKKRAIDAISNGDDGNGHFDTSSTKHDDDHCHKNADADVEGSEKDAKRSRS